MTLEQMTTFLAWNSLINIAFLIAAAFFLAVFLHPISGLHSKLFGVNRADLPPIYFKFLAGYELLTLIFCVVPYLVLRLAF